MDFTNLKKIINSHDFDSQLLQDPSTMLAFDTNTLLDLLHQPSETIQEFIDKIENSNCHKFIPYFVGWEYAKNFQRVVKQRIHSKSTRKELQSVIEKHLNELSELVEKDILPNEDISLYDRQFNDVRQSIKDSFKDIIDKAVHVGEDNSKQVQTILDTKVNSTKDVGTQVTDLVEKYIDAEFDVTQSWIDKIEKAGKERYSLKHGPGYNDSAKTEKVYYDSLSFDEKYGDLLIWKECLEYLKAHENIKKLVFVTNDGTSSKKNDLYRNGRPSLGPDPILIGEVASIRSDDLVICPLKKVVESFVPNVPYRQVLIKRNKDLEPTQFVTTFERNLEEEIEKSQEVDALLQDFIDGNVTDEPESMMDYYDVSHNILGFDIDDVSVTLEEIDSLSEFEFSSVISGSCEVYYAAPNPMYEHGEDDGESPDVSDDVILSFSIDMTGSYSSETSEFDDLSCEDVEFS